MEERPIEVETDHHCVLDLLTRRLAGARVDDSASLAADALEALLRDGTFDRCCLPRYMRLAPEHGEREVQIPVAKQGGIETRVLVWPVGSADRPHPHSAGWTVFATVTGQLVAVDQARGDGTTVGPLRLRRAAVLRPEDGVRHRLRNPEGSVAVTVHISGPRA